VYPVQILGYQHLRMVRVPVLFLRRVGDVHGTHTQSSRTTEGATGREMAPLYGQE
jgi:hypothetical protein